MKRIILTVIRYYQRAVSPGLPAACRFQPSCSRYAYEAIDRFGAARGSVIAARRLLRCMPWSRGGFDPVPERDEKGLMQCEWVIEPDPAAPDEIRVDAGRLPV